MGEAGLAGTVVCNGTTGEGGSKVGPGFSQAAFPKGGEGIVGVVHEGTGSGEIRIGGSRIDVASFERHEAAEEGIETGEASAAGTESSVVGVGIKVAEMHAVVFPKGDGCWMGSSTATGKSLSLTTANADGDRKGATTGGGGFCSGLGCFCASANFVSIAASASSSLTTDDAGGGEGTATGSSGFLFFFSLFFFGFFFSCTTCRSMARSARDGWLFVFFFFVFFLAGLGGTCASSPAEGKRI